MKYIISLFIIISLASCSAKNESNINSWNTTNNSINEELNSISSWTENTSVEWKVEKIDYTYKNPKWEEVSKSISYSLDTKWKIKTITIEWYSHKDFNKKAEDELIWKTIDEASNLYISWASLASEAFRKAIKS